MNKMEKIKIAEKACEEAKALNLKYSKICYAFSEHDDKVAVWSLWEKFEDDIAEQFKEEFRKESEKVQEFVEKYNNLIA